MNPALESRFWSKVAIFGPEACWVWQASTTRSGYGQINIGGRVIRTAHSVAYELAHGRPPSGHVIDHICRERRCVNPRHLRAVTPKQNAENRATESSGASGVRGVRWDKTRGLWSASVTHNYRTINLGRFANREEAAEVARRARLACFTHSDADRPMEAVQ